MRVLADMAALRTKERADLVIPLMQGRYAYELVADER
jgi:hypothetical protein